MEGDMIREVVKQPTIWGSLSIKEIETFSIILELDKRHTLVLNNTIELNRVLSSS